MKRGLLASALVSAIVSAVVTAAVVQMVAPRPAEAQPDNPPVYTKSISMLGDSNHGDILLTVNSDDAQTQVVVAGPPSNRVSTWIDSRGITVLNPDGSIRWQTPQPDSGG